MMCAQILFDLSNVHHALSDYNFFFLATQKRIRFDNTFDGHVCDLLWIYMIIIRFSCATFAVNYRYLEIELICL